MNLIMSKLLPICMNRYGVVNTRTGRSGVRLRAKARDFLFFGTSRTAFGLSSLLFIGYLGYFPGGKATGA